MDWNPPDAWHNTAAFLRSIAGELESQPKAIVIVSGHWEAPEFCVTGAVKPPLIYDYGGFPPHTYQLRYDAPGDPPLAALIVSLLTGAGFKADADASRGWDHGVFIPLKVMFPNAEIPVVQVSLKQGLEPDTHTKMGQALAPLRDQGVLLIGSGMSFHNMRGYGDPRFGPISDQFDDWLSSAVSMQEPERGNALAAWAEAPAGRLSHPREEHLAPLFVVAGAAPEGSGRKVFSDRILETTISAYRFD